MWSGEHRSIELTLRCTEMIDQSIAKGDSEVVRGNERKKKQTNKKKETFASENPQSGTDDITVIN